MIPKIQYVLARTRGRKTHYFYGERLKDVLGHVKDGEGFNYARFERGAILYAEKQGRTLMTELPVNRKTRGVA